MNTLKPYQVVGILLMIIVYAIIYFQQIKKTITK